jgi:4-hydroxy-3-polyprenylbenzoate decarboxylase
MDDMSKLNSGSKKSMILALTGASGAVYGLTLAGMLLDRDVEVHLMWSDTAARIIADETGRSAEDWLSDLEARGRLHYTDSRDFSSPAASGSSPMEGMVIAPCSMGALGRIASGISSNLIERAADVSLKERRKLILMCRETPLSAIHLENMARVDRAGGIIMPPVPAFYTGPRSIQDVVEHSCDRVMDLLGFPREKAFRWGGELD